MPEVEMEQRFNCTWLSYAVGPINMKRHILVKISLSYMSSRRGAFKGNAFHVTGMTLDVGRVWFMETECKWCQIFYEVLPLSHAIEEWRFLLYCSQDVISCSHEVPLAPCTVNYHANILCLEFVLRISWIPSLSFWKPPTRYIQDRNKWDI